MKQNNIRFQDMCIEWMNEDDINHQKNVDSFFNLIDEELINHIWTQFDDLNIIQIKDIVEGQVWLRRAKEIIIKTGKRHEKESVKGTPTQDRKYA